MFNNRLIFLPVQFRVVEVGQDPGMMLGRVDTCQGVFQGVSGRLDPLSSPHRGHPVNVQIRRTMHLSSVIPVNDTRESEFGHGNFPRRERGSNLGPLAPEA